MTTPDRGSRPLKEAFFVQIMTADNNLIFFDETGTLGRKMPYEKPEATCAMRVSGTAVTFSMLKHTNRSRVTAVTERLELPRGPLDRTERRAAALGKDLAPNVVAVEIEKDVHYLTISRDENGVARLESPEGVDDATLELPRGRLRLTLVMAAPRGGKIISAGFQGHVGKPETQETVPRVAALVLNLLSGLSTFRLVSGIETVTVPPSPARFQAARPALKASDRVHVTIPVRLWSADTTPVAATNVDIELDLETANPISGRLLFHQKVMDPAAAEAYEPYKALVADAALTLVSRHLGPSEVNDLVYAIALGELSSGDIGRLREATETIVGLDVNPREWATFDPNAVVV